MSDFSDWFNRKFLDWQSEQNKRETITSFAIYLGISQPNVSNYLRDASKPDSKNLLLIADKLGDEVYEKLGFKSPTSDSRLRWLIENWEQVAEAVRDEIIRIAQGEERTVVYPVLKEKPDGRKTKKSRG